MLDNTIKLTPGEQTLFRFLEHGDDVAIPDLYAAITGTRPGALPNKQQQVLLGPYLVRLNTKLRPLGMEVRPGIGRRTYRLQRSARGS